MAAAISQISGAVATGSTCLAGVLGKNIDPCVESLIIQITAFGFLSGPSLTQLQDLWDQLVLYFDGQQAGASDVRASSQYC